MDVQSSNNSVSNDGQNKKRTILWAAIGVLVALNLVLFYMLYTKNTKIAQQTATIETTNKDLETTKTKLDSISKELDVRIDEVKKLGGDISGLEQIKTQLEADKASLIADKKAANFSIEKYQDKIKSYEVMLTKKDDEIKKLKGINEELLTETTSLKQNQNKLSDSISGISQEKQKLQEKVNIAAALKVESLVIHAISEKGKERETSKDESFKAKNVDKIKIEFHLAENKITKIEGKTIYMRVLEPNGVTISDNLSGGGTFKLSGDDTPYTQKQDILYDNSKQAVTFTFRKGVPYAFGKHTVELYSEGFKIGQGSFVIK